VHNEARPNLQISCRAIVRAAWLQLQPDAAWGLRSPRSWTWETPFDPHLRSAPSQNDRRRRRWQRARSAACSLEGINTSTTRVLRASPTPSTPSWRATACGIPTPSSSSSPTWTGTTTTTCTKCSATCPPTEYETRAHRCPARPRSQTKPYKPSPQ